MSTLIIAEAGVNHNGNIDIARKLIEIAASSGADIVKFQSFKAEKLVTKSASKANYQLKTTNSLESQFEMLRSLEITDEMHNDLIYHCNKNKVKFLLTAFDVDTVDLLSGLGIDIFKIPSGEITNLPYLRHIGSFNKKVILSTGMSNIGEIEAALITLEDSGTNRANITLLHCTTEYPTPMEEVNLRAMVNMKHAFGVEVGYSDHTPGIEIPIAAVALGATVIEKHFTLDRNLPGPDHKASLEPDELKAMVKAIRNIERALGDGIKRPSPSELKNKPIARKSIVASRAIQIGELFSADNLTTKRPGTGISPMRWDDIIGRTAHRDYSIDELIQS